MVSELNEKVLPEAENKKSGVNLRTLQQYELKAKDINKAATTTLLALSKTLGCKIEDLLENSTTNGGVYRE